MNTAAVAEKVGSVFMIFSINIHAIMLVFEVLAES